ncbi:MAG: hypothetical protein AAF360_00290 [Pseudomonadota bacterium]
MKAPASKKPVPNVQYIGSVTVKSIAVVAASRLKIPVHDLSSTALR